MNPTIKPAGVCPSCSIPAIWQVDGHPRCVNCGAGQASETAIERDMVFPSVGVNVVVVSGVEQHGEEVLPFGQMEISVQAEGSRGPVAASLSSFDLSPEVMRELAGFLIKHADRVERLGRRDLAS
ncbi:MAG: hypothetical protein L6Q60_14130 [Rhodocyclaceae bacterium]|nr:hypothetical protein [Rhodocyclaceae bacterium]